MPSPTTPPRTRTVHTGLTVITGTEDRQHAYVALTRGTDTNHAYVFTQPTDRPGPGPAHDEKIMAERADLTTLPAGSQAAHTVLAAVLALDGQQQAATQIRRQALADADHLAVLHAIWATETAKLREQRYQRLLQDALPPGYRTEPGHRARWLWRTLHAAELAGLDPTQVLTNAIGERNLAGARDIPAVIDARIRSQAGALVPRPTSSWSTSVPATADPDRHAYLAEIAALMDARKERLGQHAAEHHLAWAVGALGQVPDDPGERLEWQRRAASIGAWRELSGHRDPTDPIGPEPTAAAPDLRAAWHEALSALGQAEGPAVRGMLEGKLWHLRDTYPVETAWAPRTSPISSARSAPLPGSPIWMPCARPPTPEALATAVTTPKHRANRIWPTATTLFTRRT
jgi:hypothetical protein